MLEEAYAEGLVSYSAEMEERFLYMYMYIYFFILDLPWNSIWRQLAEAKAVDAVHAGIVKYLVPLSAGDGEIRA